MLKTKEQGRLLLQQRSSTRTLNLPSHHISSRFLASLTADRSRSLKRDFSLGASKISRPISTEDNNSLKRILTRLDDPDTVVDFTTYTSLLRYCRKTENLHDGKRVHNHIVRNGLKEDLYLGSLLILMYSDCGSPEKSHEVFNNLPFRDEFVFTIILRTFARNNAGLEALQAFEQMYQEGVMPNKRIFISIFSSCCNHVDIAEGKRMHSRFQCTSFGSDIATNTALINMYIKCGSRDHANWIFDGMAELDAIAWNVMISSCLEINQGLDALQLFHHMEQQGVTPSKVTFIHGLDACGSEVVLGKGIELHCRIMGSDVESDMMVQTALINMYGKCGGLVYAKKIFSKMTCLDEVVWSAMISVYAENAYVRGAIQLFEQMLQEGMLSNKYILSSILSGCAIEFVYVEGKQMHARITCSGFALDVAVGNALVSLYGKIGCMDDAFKVFYKMFDCNLVSWNSIIGACAEHGHLQDACQIFEQMQQEGFVADKATFVNVLSASANRDSLTQGKRFHALTLVTSMSGDIQIDNALVNMYGKCGNLDYMHSIFEKMAPKNSVTWNTIISVYAQHGKDKVAFELFEEMQEKGITPDRLTFSSILSMCANQGLLFEGKRVHKLFKNRGFQPDKVVGSALISLYGKCGSLIEAKEIFNSMPEQDVVLWNSLITAFSQNGQGEYALELFNRMQWKMIRPTGVTFISVLSACSHVGRLDEACHHFDSMEKWYGITPIVDHYNCMIDLLSRAGRLDEAEELLNAMSVKPTASSLMALLGACRNILDYVRGQRIAEKVFLIDPGNPSPYVVLSSIYAAVGKVQDAVNVMMTMQGHVGVDNEDSYVGDILTNADSVEFQIYFVEEACVG